MKKIITITTLLFLSAQYIQAQQYFPNGIAADKGTTYNGAAVFAGTSYASHFHYSDAEDIYIRGGKAASTIYIGDVNANVILSNTGRNIYASGLLTAQAGIQANKNLNFGGSAVFLGTTYASHFHYSATEDTYIRGGKETSNVFIADVGNNVVIGSVPSLPSGYKLFVERGILTEKVKVAVKTSGDWADHVFHKDYPLMPLSEVEKFIRSNGHLPGVPSANTMVKEGIDLGKMNAKLLEKIEELTLYTIELKKEMAALQDEVKTLKNK